VLELELELGLLVFEFELEFELELVLEVVLDEGGVVPELLLVFVLVFVFELAALDAADSKLIASVAPNVPGSVLQSVFTPAGDIEQ